MAGGEYRDRYVESGAGARVDAMRLRRNGDFGWGFAGESYRQRVYRAQSIDAGRNVLYVETRALSQNVVAQKSPRRCEMVTSVPRQARRMRRRVSRTLLADVHSQLLRPGCLAGVPP